VLVLDPQPCPDKTRADLEWGRVLAAIADRAVTPAGKRLARALPFLTTRDEILTALAEVREARDLDAAGEPVPLGELPDIAHAIDRARIGATLSNEELRAVVACLAASRVLRRFLVSRREAAPALFAACSTDASLDELERDLAASFDPDGTLSDRASPRLAELRGEARACRDRLVRRLEELLRKYSGSVQDDFWTERDGRYVLPVRSDAHERFPGIVHGASDSGATLFVEPRAIVPLGNRQKVLDAEIAREEHAIYVALSARVADAVESLADVDRALAHADARRASAKLARELDLSFPEVPPRADLDPGTRRTFAEAARDDDAPARPPLVDLVAARHPLLALDGVKVVPSDLAVGAGLAVVVSGPNAGGKTVALKTLGLAALLVRAGLPVPAAPGSRVSAFDRVLTDVGDDQNLSKNLSSFSAHVTNLKVILEATASGTLVLLDELAGNTDPREGEALAAAVLDSLCARGGAVACTTHYDGLKALAVGDGRFQNASVGFDLATMSPTFRLAVGVPGSSSALAVARRFGVPGSVLERAERFLSHESVSFDQVVRKLEDERRALELARAAAENERDLAKQRRRDLESELERLAAREKRTLTTEGEALLAALRRAREELRGAEARLRKKSPTEDDVRVAAKALEAVARKVSIGGELEPEARAAEPPRRPLESGEARVGLKVFVPRLRAEAEIVEVLPQGQLRVAAGPLKLTTPAGEVRVAAASEPARGPGPRRSLEPFDAASDPDVPIQTTENTVDLRGLRQHEAIAMAEQFLDRSLGAGRRVAFLIHGHGTGALRLALREALGASPYVKRLRAGEPREGGDGVTVAWLR
jgi:DNA mismatch repair protein MutS2